MFFKLKCRHKGLRKGGETASKPFERNTIGLHKDRSSALRTFLFPSKKAERAQGNKRRGLIHRLWQTFVLHDIQAGSTWQYWNKRLLWLPAMQWGQCQMHAHDAEWSSEQEGRIKAEEKEDEMIQSIQSSKENPPLAQNGRRNLASLKAHVPSTHFIFRPFT